MLPSKKDFIMYVFLPVSTVFTEPAMKCDTQAFRLEEVMNMLYCVHVCVPKIYGSLRRSNNNKTTVDALLHPETFSQSRHPHQQPLKQTDQSAQHVLHTGHAGTAMSSNLDVSVCEDRNPAT